MVISPISAISAIGAISAIVAMKKIKEIYPLCLFRPVSASQWDPKLVDVQWSSAMVVKPLDSS